jgi:hypothetical protein
MKSFRSFLTWFALLVFYKYRLSKKKCAWAVILWVKRRRRTSRVRYVCDWQNKKIIFRTNIVQIFERVPRKKEKFKAHSCKKKLTTHLCFLKCVKYKLAHINSNQNINNLFVRQILRNIEETTKQNRYHC